MYQHISASTYQCIRVLAHQYSALAMKQSSGTELALKDAKPLYFLATASGTIALRVYIMQRQDKNHVDLIAEQSRKPFREAGLGRSLAGPVAAGSPADVLHA